MEKTLSLIVPVYNEEEVLETSFSRMDAVMKKIGYPYEIIYVNDGSRDGSMKILRNIAKNNPQVKVRSFSRNFGHQLAVTCGMDAAKGDALIIIDVDLQDPPEVIEQMVKARQTPQEAGRDYLQKAHGCCILPPAEVNECNRNSA